MSGFDFKEVKERSPFVGYGITNSATIVKVTNAVSQNGKPFIQVDFKVTGEKDETASSQKFYMSDGAKNISMVKLMLIHQAVGKLETLKSQPFNSVEELASGLNSLWSGRKLRIKLSAREYLGEKDGEPVIKVTSEVPIRDFVEAIDPGAEMFPITDDKTQLTFDEKNKYDWKRYEGADAPTKSDTSGSAEKEDDLPF